ncbi:MAG TPA: glycosyltransferase family 2 protein [Steroidobacteraceae bacterium]|nr:glycosyltransferase family 2 protein [Steroidobacteraceae bacterium]
MAQEQTCDERTASERSVPDSAHAWSIGCDFDHSLGTDGQSNALSAFCVTLYNEKRQALEATFRSILVAVNYCLLRQPGLHGAFVVCLIADGRDAVDPDILQWLHTLRVTARSVKTASEEFFLEAHSAESPLLQLEGSALAKTVSARGFHTVVCIKDNNLGKLQSHALFFETICTRMQPEFVFQIDVGTVLASNTIFKLLERLRLRPELAAVAPRVMPAVPASNEGFLAQWQYADFAARKAILWPFELATGHLSVIPGQTCVFRWRALHTVRTVGEVDKPADPLSDYLCGMDTLGCLGRIMYLAEDRVIGSRIVLAARSDWKLGYSPDASAETDACTSLRELLRQRRRWNNSEMATRVWLVGQVPDILRRTDRNARQNGRFALAAFSQAILAAREFFLPAQLVAALAALVPASRGLPRGLPALLFTMWLMSLGAWIVVETVVGKPCPLKLPIRWKTVRRDLYWVSAALFLVILVFTVPLPCTVALLVPALCLPNVCIVLPRSGVASAALARAFYLPHLAMAALLSCYSLWRLDDVSWGTKGLQTAVTKSACSARLRKCRNTSFCAWVFANSVTAFVAIMVRGSMSQRLNPVLAILGTLELVMIIIALLRLIIQAVGDSGRIAEKRRCEQGDEKRLLTRLQELSTARGDK